MAGCGIKQIKNGKETRPQWNVLFDIEIKIVSLTIMFLLNYRVRHAYACETSAKYACFRGWRDRDEDSQLGGMGPKEVAGSGIAKAYFGPSSVSHWSCHIKSLMYNTDFAHWLTQRTSNRCHWMLFFCVYISRIMARKRYKMISTDDDKAKPGFICLLFFRWMNTVFKTGSERALEQDDFLHLSKQNSTRLLTEQLQASWNKEKTKGKANGKKPKLWKSIVKLVSAKDAMLMSVTIVLRTISRLLHPLFLGYLTATLMAAESQQNYLLYGCALAMCLNAFIGSIGVHHFDYRCEVMAIRISSALKGLIYLKVSQSKTFTRFWSILGITVGRTNWGEGGKATSPFGFLFSEHFKKEIYSMKLKLSLAVHILLAQKFFDQYFRCCYGNDISTGVSTIRFF